MQIYKFETSATSSGGTLSINTLNMLGGICHQIYIKASTSDTTFGVKITDANSRVIREYDLSPSFILDENPLIMQGVYTFQIVNGSHDQSYDILLMVREK